ncbi:apolipoprotein N-acyltransferase [Novipirellula artificiosorum]|uniref:Apolipoprotein N-acyltransferase n=1 Tax=Novipirellula artificiosorum TaxID=2528016 RepID=A0A5C6DF27_9BACT|nr:apolipoprotein N-acyltransferase [Novipirellula artificiosorum]TWU34351.1 Apolipoprotein N-acyltransferase [Novipirellula artificiosorum]
MNAIQSIFRSQSSRGRFALACLSLLLLWLAQPPLKLWPLAMVALVPLLSWIATLTTLCRRDVFAIWAVSACYWMVSLQGIRHAHPIMYVSLILLAAYLGVYVPLFVLLCRRLLRLHLPLALVAPVVWVGLECWRNYFATGISAAMLGHTVVDVPALIQIADLFGSYGVSFLIVSINVAILSILTRITAPDTPWFVPCATGVGLLLATLVYGHHRLGETPTDELATFALIQRSEQVEYQQDARREDEIYRNYAGESIRSLEQSRTAVDVVVWPESMFTGGLPWMMMDTDAIVPPQFPGPPSDFPSAVEGNRRYFLDRTGDVMNLLESANPSHAAPHLVVGCGVVHYGDVPSVYSGMIHVAPVSESSPEVKQWYGKNHLVMFGEYVPLIHAIPGLRSLVPDGLMVTPGDGPTVFEVDGTNVLPLICIETAVERVAVDHLRRLRAEQTPTDVIVTVTNDGWFDDSSVIEHHLRCAQMIAVGTRRPVLSSANNGPTAWIDSCGRVVEGLSIGSNGAVIATPLRDARVSIYSRIGDLPAKGFALLCLMPVLGAAVARVRKGEFKLRPTLL